MGTEMKTVDTPEGNNGWCSIRNGSAGHVDISQVGLNVRRTVKKRQADKLKVVGDNPHLRVSSYQSLHWLKAYSCVGLFFTIQKKTSNHP